MTKFHVLFFNLDDKDVMFHGDLAATLRLKLLFLKTHNIFILNPWLV